MTDRAVIPVLLYADLPHLQLFKCVMCGDILHKRNRFTTLDQCTLEKHMCMASLARGPVAWYEPQPSTTALVLSNRK